MATRPHLHDDRPGPGARDGALAQIEQVEQQLQALKESLIPSPSETAEEAPATTAN